MENTRRKLRNANTCPEIENIFRNKTGKQELISLLPTSLAKKIGNFQKVSCNLVNQLPQLVMQEPLPSEIQKVVKAQESQSQWLSSMPQNDRPMINEKVTIIHEAKIQQGDQPFFMETFLNQRKRSTHEQMEEERKPELWKDSSFLQNLNDFLMLEDPNNRSLFIPEELIEK